MEEWQNILGGGNPLSKWAIPAITPKYIYGISPLIYGIIKGISCYNIFLYMDYKPLTKWDAHPSTGADLTLGGVIKLFGKSYVSKVATTLDFLSKGN